ncbi:hypothetical protein RIF29_00201 [Crotalaria pallida]|uniref:Uncharacterized protein n=1 Tax=Crotalaria pallida TaxID=3830 RepID=A0AAN9P6H4_CROPI
MSVISFGYKLWEGDVTLKDEVCQMLGYVRCKKWNVIDAVGNTHEIRIQQLRAGGKLAITDGLDNIMDISNNIQRRFYTQYANVSGAAVPVKRFSLIPLPESFVAAALPLSSGEHYLVDEDNVEHPVELVRSIRNPNESYLTRYWFDFCVVFHIVAGSTFKLAIAHAH